jgi:UDP-N-acetylmuramoyl-tripeptide--D-alanyl-D-alanine ligase
VSGKKEIIVSRLSAAEVQAGTGGILAEGSGGTVFSSVSIDTRTLQKGALFFAIRGPNQDGHRFVPDAFTRGASGAVVAQDYEYPGKFPSDRALIKVADTHQALKFLAMATRNIWSGTLVAITGSMGKTTTREFAAQVMESKSRVYQTPGNYNNLYGLPLALFGLSFDYDIGIFEMGMSAPGEIAEMCRIASPVVGIITNVAPVHLEFFDSIEQIGQAKAEIAEALPAEGILIYNADDPLVRKIAARFPGSKISFGFSDQADVRAEEVKITSLEQTRFKLSCDGISRPAVIPFAGAHYVMNALAAAALGRKHKITLAQIIESLEKLKPVAMRGKIMPFKEGFRVIDDSYNSNPRALMQMIEVLAGVPGFKRRILVAGEMLELGIQSETLHAQCGSFAADQGLDIVVGIQGAARKLVQAAADSGIPEPRTRYFGDSGSAAEFVCGIVEPGDLVLIKGSRGVHTEQIVKTLLSHKATAPK